MRPQCARVQQAGLPVEVEFATLIEIEDQLEEAARAILDGRSSNGRRTLRAVRAVTFLLERAASEVSRCDGRCTARTSPADEKLWKLIVAIVHLIIDELHSTAIMRALQASPHRC